MKFKKKPVTIHAIEWRGDIDELKWFCERFEDSPDDHFSLSYIQGDLYALRVNTLEGESYEVPIGYMVIRGVRGEYYPCERDIFFETYDPC